MKIKTSAKRVPTVQPLFKEKVTPRPDADGEMMNVVLEIDRKVKEEIARRYSGSGNRENSNSPSVQRS